VIAVGLLYVLQWVTFDIRWTSDLGKKDLRADRSELRLGSWPSLSNREKESGGFRLSVPLPGKKIAIPQVLVSTHEESGLGDPAPPAVFALKV
jgi:hypothetical protein